MASAHTMWWGEGQAALALHAQAGEAGGGTALTVQGPVAEQACSGMHIASSAASPYEGARLAPQSSTCSRTSREGSQTTAKTSR